MEKNEKMTNKVSVCTMILLSIALFLSGCIGTEEKIQTPTIPNIIIGVDSYNPPAYRGNSTFVTLAI
ncbi:MAG: hypothetical protein PHH85_09430, partial [Candidatus Methanoperedens sp.]|nr:hypothetical protein [Candidatus Methanoperedens sp.]